ncbi:estradiol 17-beta-dehydrogenase 12-A [Aspergillus steynii IBT 23096]|uniref:Estradiol 17-beta-dehydrogenase 12-A n=1 Tax=Aspergillus steynii IBT 23096 TaxID=1392250 RepID=A0A2I2FV93_9EURO|nr:estradiol 17-beta-dehydrogenase 12-A [Aspergillus steynii IBT 23096]PLB44568.1 estradiol 17-beta-dehydrogenase 12-A [Aspergillus steynii IBT 23096]
MCSVCHQKAASTLHITMIQLPIYISGVLVHLYILTKLCLHAATYLFPSSIHEYLSTTEDHESWALITGSTAGIGFGFAQELCAHGFNVIIHGKDDQELQDAAAQLRSAFPLRSIRTFLFDASTPTASLATSLTPVLQDISLRVLVNNVGGQGGQTRSTYQRLRDFSSEEVTRVMNVNAHFTTQLTRILLPVLSRAPSLVLNISSLSATGLPYLSVYAASKAYIDSFTRALHAEMRAENMPVSVQGIICGNVQSDGHPLAEGWFVPTSRGMARAALQRLGPGSRHSPGFRLGYRPVLVAAYWPHVLQAWGYDILPEAAREWISIRVLRGLKDEWESVDRRVR